MNIYEEALAEAIPLAEGVKDWRSTRAYRLWRIVVIKRDKACVICGSNDRRHAHHVNHASYFPEQRFDADNGVCMCSGCHMNYHNNFHRSTRVKCTRYEFDNFVHLSSYLFGIKQEQIAEPTIELVFPDPESPMTQEEHTRKVVELLSYIANDFCIDGSAVMKLRRGT